MLDELICSQLMAVLLRQADTYGGESVTIQLAESVVAINFTCAELKELYAPALAHLAMSQRAEVDLTLSVCDSDSHPLPKSIRSRIAQLVDYDALGDASPIFYRQNSDQMLAIQVSASFVTIDFYDATRNRAVRWVSNSTQFAETAPDQLCYPFRTLFAWYGARHGYCLIHGSAVADQRGAVLFVGTGGAGKSSCALMAALCGKEFVADDSVLVRCSDEPTICSLYCTSRVRPSDLSHYPSLAISLDARRAELAGRDDKITLFMGGAGVKVSRQAVRLRAVIVPEIVPSRSTPTVSRIHPTEALRRLAPSSLLHIPGYGQTALKQFAHIVRSVPCYRWQLGAERGAVLDLVEHALAGLDKR